MKRQRSGVVWCAVLCCAVLCCGVVWCGVVWCGVVWCGVVCCRVSTKSWVCTDALFLRKLPPRALSSPRITSPRILNSEGANGKPPMPIIPSLGSLEGLPRPSVDLASVSPRVESARDATEAEADLRAQVVETKDQLLTTQQALRLVCLSGMGVRPR